MANVQKIKTAVCENNRFSIAPVLRCQLFQIAKFNDLVLYGIRPIKKLSANLATAHCGDTEPLDFQASRDVGELHGLQ